MSVQSILEMLVTTEDSQSEAEVLQALERLLSVYGFDYYTMFRQLRLKDDGSFDVFGCHMPDGWADHYRQQSYMAIDPVMRYLAVAQRPFRWHQAMAFYRADPNVRHMEKMMQDAARAGLVDGYFFPMHGRNGLIGALTIGGKEVELSASELSLFQAAAKAAYWKLRRLSQQTDEGDERPNASPEVTRRELQVLLHLADGLTSNEISRVLSISPHTVDWYMSGIQTKLGARNRQHAVAIAFRTGMLF